MSRTREQLELIMGRFPDHVSDAEVPYIDALASFILTDDYKPVSKIPAGRIRLLRVKFVGFNGDQWLDPDSETWVPTDQFLAAMDLRLGEIERRDRLLDGAVGAAIGAIVTLAATLVVGS